MKMVFFGFIDVTGWKNEESNVPKMDQSYGLFRCTGTIFDEKFDLFFLNAMRTLIYQPKRTHHSGLQLTNWTNHIVHFGGFVPSIPRIFDLCSWILITLTKEHRAFLASKLANPTNHILRFGGFVPSIPRIFGPLKPILGDPQKLAANRNQSFWPPNS
jgi:hypothetical protein